MRNEKGQFLKGSSGMAEVPEMEAIRRSKISFARKGKPLTKEHKLKLSLIKLGKPNGRIGIPLTEEHKAKLRAGHGGKPRPWRRGVPLLSMRGENHPNWKGGVTPLNLQIRHSLEYKNWRRKVFERDDYTCQWCGTRGGYIEADHIKPFALFPELRFELTNGRTLCRPCHNTTKWGRSTEKIYVQK